MKKLLYISCHITLESDELEMFNSLGFSSVVVGNFLEKGNPFHLRKDLPHSLPWSLHDWKEPNINRDEDLTKEFLAMNPSFHGVDANQNLNFTKEFLNKFDAIVVSNTIKYLQQVVTMSPKCPVFYCTAGQTCPSFEGVFKRFRDFISIVRYAEGEEMVGNYAGADAFISCRISDDFLNQEWKGDIKEIMTVSRAMPIRPRETSYQTFLEIAEPFGAKIFGSGNEAVAKKYNGGQLPYNLLLESYSRYRAFIATGTHPSPMVYTFLEALGAGTPTICLGPKLARRYMQHNNLYALDRHITNGVNGFKSDDIREIQGYVKQLLADDKLCKTLSENGKNYVRDNFSTPVITNKWKALFEEKGAL